MANQLLNIRGCARCGHDHVEVEMRRLENPIAPADFPALMWDHWAPCPYNGQPILIRVLGVEGASDHLDTIAASV